MLEYLFSACTWRWTALAPRRCGPSTWSASSPWSAWSRVVLVTLMGQIRLFYAVGRDGLLPEAFARVHPRTHTPHIGTIVTGIVSCVAAGILPLRLLGDIISMGTLLAFGIVCGGVLVLRRPFKAPGGIWVPARWRRCRAWPGSDLSPG